MRAFARGPGQPKHARVPELAAPGVVRLETQSPPPSTNTRTHASSFSFSAAPALNAGVFVADMWEWRKQGIIEQLLHWSKRNMYETQAPHNRSVHMCITSGKPIRP